MRTLCINIIILNACMLMLLWSSGICQASQQAREEKKDNEKEKGGVAGTTSPAPAKVQDQDWNRGGEPLAIDAVGSLEGGQSLLATPLQSLPPPSSFTSLPPPPFSFSSTVGRCLCRYPGCTICTYFHIILVASLWKYVQISSHAHALLFTR